MRSGCSLDIDNELPNLIELLQAKGFFFDFAMVLVEQDRLTIPAFPILLFAAGALAVGGGIS